MGRVIPTDPSPASLSRVRGPSFRVRSRLSPLLLTSTILHWCLWGFIMALMLSQLLTAISNTSTSQFSIQFGQNVSHGLYSIPGNNDEPYADRLVACVRRGREFKAVGLSEALNSGSTTVEDVTGLAIHGYRVVHRTGLTLSEPSKQQWTRTCRLVNATLTGIFQACEALGYDNLTHNSLRIMDGNSLKNIPNALPVLIMPFWDNALNARSVIPAWDGHACLFRLQGQYENPASPQIYLAGVDRAIREKQTISWLGRPGGQWKNGWYEDKQGMRWYSDVVAKANGNVLFPRFFDPSIEKEMKCVANSSCPATTRLSSWSDELQSVGYYATEISIAISNGTRFGLFYYYAGGVKVVTCVYDFATLISNASVVFLLLRWMIAMLALHRGYFKGVSNWYGAGIGSIAHTSTFTYLPIAMAPHTKTILAVFYTVGCNFEGEQKALADAWFVIYPSIVDFVLIYASILNTVAKCFRRRMSDRIFPFTIVTFSSLHFFRQEICSNAFFNIGGRTSTKIASHDFDQLTVFDMFSADVALRMGGNVAALLWLKLLILSASIALLLVSDNMSLQSKRSRGLKSCNFEQALKIRACNVGGIGLYRAQTANTLSSYELIRLGYVVFGSRYLMTVDNWLVLTTVKQLRSIYSLWNHRIMIFQVVRVTKGGDLFQVNSYGQLMSIHDPMLNCIPWWDIDARTMK